MNGDIFIDITVDTTPPRGVTANITGKRGDGTPLETGGKTYNQDVTLHIGCADEDTSKYYIKIWGDAVTENESDADWSVYDENVDIRLRVLTPQNGERTVYVKVIDDVFNESEAVPASVTVEINPPKPFITLGTSRVKLSGEEGKSMVSGQVVYGACDVCAYKFAVVPDPYTRHNDSGTLGNRRIPVAGGSSVTFSADTGHITQDGTYLEGREENGGYLMTGDVINFNIALEDILSASPGDGAKIIKAFVQDNNTRLWSE